MNELIGKEVKILIDEQVVLIGNISSVENSNEDEIEVIVTNSTEHEYIVQFSISVLKRNIKC